MTFRNKLKSIRGLRVKLPEGSGVVREYYEDTDRVLITLDAGTNYTTENKGIVITFISDGYDTIVMEVSQFERFN